MRLTVDKIKHVLTEDIDSTQQMDVAIVDGFVSSCTTAAQNALANATPHGFTDFERDQLRHVIQGQRYSHLNIRNLLRKGETPESVDVLAIARLQLETLYSFCFMLQDAANVRVFLKHGWKKKYVRFLLQREEYKNLDRFREYFENQALPSLERLRQILGVTEDEKLTIEYQELGVTPPPGFQLAAIQPFPTPGVIIRKIRDQDRKRMLERLYPEYEFLCSFAHGDSEAALFRAIVDPHSEAQRFSARSLSIRLYVTLLR